MIAGFLILAIGIWMAVGGIEGLILRSVDSPVTSEAEVFNMIFDSLQQSPLGNNEESAQALKQAKRSISLFNLLPFVLIFIGIILIILGFFIP